QMLLDWIDETDLTGSNEAFRSLYGAFVPDVNGYDYANASLGYVWKYSGIGMQTQVRNTVNEQDPNYMVYRVADIMLMKAEAMILSSADIQGWTVAIDLINEVRVRANLPARNLVLEELSEADMLELVLYERNMELAGEGKRWYDLLRFGKRDGFKYRGQFLVDRVIDYNNTANPAWIRSVLNNDDALYLPIETSELENNRLLVQNPYFQATN
nr:RagB/SusD family nutrient uptake outer membrane protein [Sunxiuqinia sp.]